ncbi:RHS repeat-associated core domain-containing protein [Geodermatophilus amargosae]|uniref:RHS repeat-associated core domain-containing protein n=1 Tax=Geodermatophilus amargosae TaxID=1296565 RepID=A0A1I7CPB2_9ACTN|nr:SpvB/TcaC N-terminal domain-containing protein [Geodermatophilus amargosae]SFU01179.1 RHS repeat-associated core domain-containing protein [Geodermatophilus amargosae]
MARPPELQAPTVELPRGGGAIRGIGEKFSANPVTGTATLTIPLPASPGRSGFGPSLTLSYDSGGAQGSFGMGWGIGLPTITRKTDKGLPTYDDTTDTFLLSGVEDLVPVIAGNGSPGHRSRTAGGREYAVTRYRPRIEGLHARIERWRDLVTGDVHWRSISRTNVTTVYGKDRESRIADPEDERRVFSWLICESWDDRGNAVTYQYAPEDSTGVQLTAAHESHRTGRASNRHLTSVRYGNRISHLLEPDPAAQSWHFELLFDYGEYAAEAPTPADEGEWLCRNDPFSTYRAGFEIRNYRLCQRILMFHHFPDEPVGADCLVRSMTLTYRGTGDQSRRGEPGGAFLASVRVAGHRRPAGGGPYVVQALPPVEFAYSICTVGAQVHELAATTVENLPVGLDGPGYQWIDLDGESIAGVLTEQAGAWFYAANRGGGELGPVRVLPTQPAGSAGAQLLDLTGKGALAYASFAGPTPGFFERVDGPAGERGWAPHRSLRSVPAIDWTDPDLQLVDLNGDGRADLLRFDDDGLVWYPSLGEDGFAAGIRLAVPLDERAGPRVVVRDRTQVIFLADMSGDGLTDLVRISNAGACYWPSLGYGRFGAQVVMDGPSAFDHPDRFDPRRIRLADVDGSGPSDLVYLGADGVDLYANQLGNRLAAPVRVRAFPAVDDLASISVVDLLGRGTACLVWSSALPGDAGRQIRYVDLMGEKPNLLTGVRNNLGAETALTYASSTESYLADRSAGRPWITRLPFPVHVLTCVETCDRISRNRFVTTYAYHHGHFDPQEREFRGFGLVEQHDTELMAAMTGTSDFPAGAGEDAATRSPAVLTRSWFDTGVHRHRDRISTLFADGYYPPPEHATAAAARLLLPNTVLPPGLSSDDERQACRALKGQLLRQEVYACDGTDREPHPYTVSERNYSVIQHAPGVFAVHPRDSVTVNYERNPADPRVSHAVTLDVDDFGTVLHSVALAYRRAVADRALPARTARAQGRTLITEIRNEVTAPVDREDAHRAPVTWRTRTSEVTVAELTGADALVDRDDLVAALERPGGRRLVGSTFTLFERDDLGGALPPGDLGTRGLAHEVYRLVLTPELVTSAFGARVDEAVLTAAGHRQVDGGWWAPSGIVRYAPPDITDAVDVAAHARAHFVIPRQAVDPFGGSSAVVLDRYDLQALESTDAVGNATTARPDYRVLAPTAVTDPNGNRVEALVDALGLVVATAVVGSTADDTLDRVAGLDPEPTTAAFWRDPDAQAQALLGTASTRVVYDLDAYLRTRDDADPQPAATATIARERHVRDEAASPVQVSVSYSDGMGREIQRKSHAEPAGHWIGSGWTVFNNKGLPVRQFEPFSSTTHRFEFAVEAGVSPTLCYDPVGRVVATVHPDQTWDKVVIGAWQLETWDAGDTALIVEPARDGDVGPLLEALPQEDHTPTWYQQRITGGAGPEERAAAERTELYAGTPTLTVLDPLGRPVLTVARNRTPGTPPVDSEHRTHAVLDVTGNELEVRDCTDGTPGLTTDTAERLVARYTYDLAGARIVEESMEAGTRRGLADVLGMPLAGWDHTDRRTTTVYDAARRPIAVILREGNDEQVIGRTVYGETATDASANLRGRVWEVRDGAGLLTHAYDLAGNPAQLDRQLTDDYRRVVDWSAAPLLDPTTWTVRTVFDALNRPTGATHPDGTVVRSTYDRTGRLRQVRARLARDSADTSFVEGITYDAKGQRTRVAHGNGVTTRYGYDERTFRLRTLDTRAPAGERVQQLRYTYDAVGNITRVTDAAQPDVFNVNTLIEAKAEYRYDAVSRLVEATGREHRGNDTATTWDDALRTNPADGNDLRRYTESYDYDVAGNLIRLVHGATVGAGWTRSFNCTEPSQLEPAMFSNRLSSSRVGSGQPETYTYDDQGNMLTLAPMVFLRWNHLGQLVASSRQAVAASGVGEITYYVYDGAGRRIRKVTDHAAGSREAATRRTERVYLGGFELYRTFDPGGAVTLVRTTLHVGDGAGRVAMVEDDGHERLVRYQYNNHLGSVVAELDANAVPISYEEFYPYGSTALLLSRSGTPPKRYRYTAQERDEETGCNFHAARYCAPWLCRWTSADPVGLLAGINLFRFADANPVVLSDPTGTSSAYPNRCDVCAAVVGANAASAATLPSNAPLVAPETVVKTRIPALALPSDDVAVRFSGHPHPLDGYPVPTHVVVDVDPASNGFAPSNPARIASPGQHALGHLRRLVVETLDGVEYRYTMPDGPYYSMTTDVEGAAFGTGAGKPAFSGTPYLVDLAGFPEGSIIRTSEVIEDVRRIVPPERADKFVGNQPFEQEILADMQSPVGAVTPLEDARVTLEGEIVSPPSRTSRLISGAVNVGATAVKWAGRILTVYGAYEMATRNAESVSGPGVFAGTFVWVAMAGVADDALAASTLHMGAAPVLDSWSKNGAGPIQVMTADVLLEYYQWAYR